MQSRTLLISLAAIAVGALVALLIFGQQLTGPLSRSGPIVTGKALVGGPFSLLDHHGRRVSEKDFAGRYMLVYFGYTYCPDVCPAELQVMSEGLRLLGDKQAREITPIFITIDPKRDDVTQMASYVANFHPRLVGLTGTEAEITKAAKAYRVYFAKVTGDGADDDAYTMDHTSIIYLMDSDGAYLAHFPHGTSAPKMAERLAKLIR